MTKLLRPSMGEVWDRLTILGLKITNFQLNKLDVSHFKQEQQELHSYLEQMEPHSVVSTTRGRLITNLGQVNKMLWDAEDLVRTTPDTDVQRLAWLCRQIQKLNDSRSTLVKDISETGPGQSKQEKIYKT